MKKRGKAIRNVITGRVDRYSKAKTIGIRNVITGKIERRVKKRKNWV